jgi:UDP-glucose:(heptosyl)LPS alpha-1,3-glucosyltransferase
VTGVRATPSAQSGRFPAPDLVSYRERVRIALVYAFMRLDAGVPKMHVNLARYLLSRGHEVHIYGSAEASDTTLAPGAVFHDLGISPVRSGRLSQPLDRLRFLRRAGVAVRRDAGSNDVVHGRGMSTPVQDIVHMTGLVRSERSGRLAGFGRSPGRRLKTALSPIAAPMQLVRARFERSIADDASIRIHAETAAVRDDLISHYRVAPHRIQVVVPAIDTVAFRQSDDPAAARRSVGWTTGAPVVAFCGHDYERKGLDRVVRALALMSQPARLVVMGGGSHAQGGWGADSATPYRRLAEALSVGDRVDFLGARTDVPALLRAADVLAHPARYEVWGLAVGEAMASGLPVVVTREVGAAELVEDGKSGVVLGSGDDVHELAAALDRFLAPGVREAAGRAARAAAEAVSVEQQGAKVEADMEDIVRRRRL